MEYYSCHTVAGKRFGKPGANPGGIGPNLTADYGKLPRESPGGKHDDRKKALDETPATAAAHRRRIRCTDAAD